MTCRVLMLRGYIEARARAMADFQVVFRFRLLSTDVKLLGALLFWLD